MRKAEALTLVGVSAAATVAVGLELYVPYRFGHNPHAFFSKSEQFFFAYLIWAAFVVVIAALYFCWRSIRTSGATWPLTLATAIGVTYSIWAMPLLYQFVAIQILSAQLGAPGDGFAAPELAR